MAQGHSGINPADPGPPSRGGGFCGPLSDNVGRMIVKKKKKKPGRNRASSIADISSFHERKEIYV